MYEIMFYFSKANFPMQKQALYHEAGFEKEHATPRHKFFVYIQYFFMILSDDTISKSFLYHSLCQKNICGQEMNHIMDSWSSQEWVGANSKYKSARIQQHGRDSSSLRFPRNDGICLKRSRII